ncbi:MAG: hypothetical protein DRR11_05150 [Gammaproteobacteria bacterium]|nr:MAG: hypothetical protein DRR15_15730 [Gammaproteobacteria bacterium]RLA33617.1 MAG: hypothetical protein DRR11_05150 [Gammaproteobacteria bacterium]
MIVVLAHEIVVRIKVVFFAVCEVAVRFFLVCFSAHFIAVHVVAIAIAVFIFKAVVIVAIRAFLCHALRATHDQDVAVDVGYAVQHFHGDIKFIHVISCRHCREKTAAGQGKAG